MDACAQKLAFSPSEDTCNGYFYFKEHIFGTQNAFFILTPDRKTFPLKSYFLYRYRACPTNGSDCGSFLTQSNLIRYEPGKMVEGHVPEFFCLFLDGRYAKNQNEDGELLLSRLHIFGYKIFEGRQFDQN